MSMSMGTSEFDSLAPSFAEDSDYSYAGKSALPQRPDLDFTNTGFGGEKAFDGSSIGPDEVPPDLFARISDNESQSSAQSSRSSLNDENENESHHSNSEEESIESKNKTRNGLGSKASTSSSRLGNKSDKSDAIDMFASFDSEGQEGDSGNESEGHGFDDGYFGSFPMDSVGKDRQEVNSGFENTGFDDFGRTDGNDPFNGGASMGETGSFAANFNNSGFDVFGSRINVSGADQKDQKSDFASAILETFNAPDAVNEFEATFGSFDKADEQKLAESNESIAEENSIMQESLHSKHSEKSQSNQSNDQAIGDSRDSQSVEMKDRIDFDSNEDDAVESGLVEDEIANERDDLSFHSFRSF